MCVCAHNNEKATENKTKWNFEAEVCNSLSYTHAIIACEQDETERKKDKV